MRETKQSVIEWQSPNRPVGDVRLTERVFKTYLVLNRCRIQILACAMLLALWFGCVSLLAIASEVLDIADHNQVFIDGRFLGQAKNVRIRVVPPLKTYERCLVGNLRGYETVLPVDGVFRGFHALTKDGTRWRRVTPGVAPEPDDILGLYDGESVPFVDPLAPAEERYKLLHSLRFQGRGDWIRVSADGASWQDKYQGVFPEEAQYPRGMDSQNVCFYDTRLKQYVAYVRVNKAYPAPTKHQAYFQKLSTRNYGKPGLYFLRAIGRSATDDLSRFPTPVVVMEPDSRDPHFDGVGVMDFYTPQVFPYPYAQDAYFMFPSRYLHYEDWFLRDDLSSYPLSGVETLNTGILDIGFAASRDGIRWERYDRSAWIPLGKKGSFDSLSLYMCRGLFLQGDEIWMYYVGYDTLHGDKNETQKAHPVMSRVALRKDGFTAVEADYTGGEFTTPPLRFDGERLSLNVETSALGLLRVEILDQSGTPIPGYGLEDCDRIHTTNSTRREVTWRGRSSVKNLSGRVVRLRFELRFGAKLYAFQFIAS